MICNICGFISLLLKGGTGVSGKPVAGVGDGLNGTGIPIIGARPGISNKKITREACLCKIFNTKRHLH